jgi:uncharacterized protein
MTLSLHVDQATYAVCQLETLPTLSSLQGFISLTCTDEEISLVCTEEAVPSSATNVEKQWRMLRVAGTLDFSEIGIIAGISRVLAEASISLFVLSTYNTDYILVKQSSLEQTLTALQAKGYRVVQGAMPCA